MRAPLSKGPTPSPYLFSGWSPSPPQFPWLPHFPLNPITFPSLSPHPPSFPGCLSFPSPPQFLPIPSVPPHRLSFPSSHQFSLTTSVSPSPPQFPPHHLSFLLIPSVPLAASVSPHPPSSPSLPQFPLALPSMAGHPLRSPPVLSDGSPFPVPHFLPPPLPQWCCPPRRAPFPPWPAARAARSPQGGSVRREDKMVAGSGRLAALRPGGACRAEVRRQRRRPRCQDGAGVSEPSGVSGGGEVVRPLSKGRNRPLPGEGR